MTVITSSNFSLRAASRCLGLNRVEAEAAFNQLRHQPVQRAARSRCLPQYSVAVRTLQHGALQALHLPLDASYPAQHSSIICTQTDSNSQCGTTSGFGGRQQYRSDEEKEQRCYSNDQGQGEERPVPACSDARLRRIGWVIANGMVTANRELLRTLHGGFVVLAFEAGEFGDDGLARHGVHHLQLRPIKIVVAGGDDLAAYHL